VLGRSVRVCYVGVGSVGRYVCGSSFPVLFRWCLGVVCNKRREYCKQSLVGSFLFSPPDVVKRTS